MHLRWRFAQFLELRWWQHYLAPKPVDAYLNWKKNYWILLLNNCGISIPAGAAVLDAGCGPAGIFMVLEKYQVDATDPLLEQYADKIPHFRPADYRHVQFFTQRLELFHPNKQYDVIFCLNAINHTADLASGLRQLRSLLKPDGQLFLSTDLHRYSWLKQVFRVFPADVLHPQQHDLNDYRILLSQHGFAVQRSVLLKRAAIFDYHLFVCVAGDMR